MRTVADMLQGIEPPLAPGCNAIGRLMVDLGTHQCRFPLRGEGVGTRFCAAQVSEADWLPGAPGRCYCQFHRRLTEGRGTGAERAAPRVLERLA